MSNSDFEQQLLRRLDILIRLQLEAPRRDEPASMAETIRQLQQCGCSPSETAKIVGKAVNYVTATLSSKKRVGRGKS